MRGCCADGLSLGIEEDKAAAAAMGFVDDSKGLDLKPNDSILLQFDFVLSIKDLLSHVLL